MPNRQVATSTSTNATCGARSKAASRPTIEAGNQIWTANADRPADRQQLADGRWPAAAAARAADGRGVQQRLAAEAAQIDATAAKKIAVTSMMPIILTAMVAALAAG